MLFTEDEVVAATLSLYADRLKPYGRILIRRIGELACAQSGADSPPFICPKGLRALCEDSPRLLVRPEDGREYSVVLAGDDSHAFVDPADKRDPYPQGMWDFLAAHFAEDGGGLGEARPGSRYACALALAELKLPCMHGLSFGEINHVVALAMGSRKILGWSAAGRAVPYHKSEAGIKLQCAANAMPVPCGPDAPSLLVSSWEIVRACLWKLLTRAEKRGKEMQLPNVKRLFRSEFGLVLSETALGHERLQDLLQDPRLHDICVLRRRDVGHHVVVEKAVGAPAAAEAIRTPMECSPMRPPLRTAPPTEAASAQPAPPAWQRRTSDGSTTNGTTSDSAAGSTIDISDTGSEHSCSCTPGCAYRVVNTFVHVPGPESTARLAARRLHRTLPPSTRLARHVAVVPPPSQQFVPPASQRGTRTRSTRGGATSNSVAVGRAR
jgi:hypothetical protein